MESSARVTLRLTSRASTKESREDSKGPATDWS